MSNEKIDLIASLAQNEIVEFTGNEDEIDSSAPVTKINLTKKNYQLNDYIVVISSPFEIAPQQKTKIKCQNMLILNKGNVSNLEIEGSLNVKNTILQMKDCIIHSSNDSSQGIVVVTSSNLYMENCEVYDGNIPGFYIEQNSKAEIESCHIHDVNHTLFATSLSKSVSINNSKFHNSPHNGVHSYQTDILITNSEFYSTSYPSISASNSKCTIKNTTVYDIEQNGISLENIKNGEICDCTLHDVKATGISANRNSVCKFHDNKFASIGGNAFHITDQSHVEIYNNSITDCLYPAFAILLQCTAQVHDNTVHNCDLSGMCIRNATEVSLYDNEFIDINDCGVSISDTEKAIIHDNKIKNCKVAAIECYNNSQVQAENNQIDGIGQGAFLSYAKAKIVCKDNDVSNVKQCFARLLCHGSGEFTNNKITNCPKLIDDSTTGDYFFEDNSDFENVTNMESKFKEECRKNILHKKNNIKVKNLCLNCQKNERDSYFHPCGHQVYCHKCAYEALEKKECCVLCRFPIEKILDGFHIDDEESRCIICRENPVDSIILPCGHIGFCSECLVKWFVDNNSCPFCRTEHSFFKKIIDLD